jgi:protein tyrosine phosphatase
MMLDYFIEWILKSNDNEKAIAHCSAGIGRTGTTISLMDIIIRLHAFKNSGITNPEISIFNTVRKLREHRYNSVQTVS